MRLILYRRGRFDFGTYGEMMLPSGIRIFTVERPWLDNAPNVSCIPLGNYEVEPTTFYRGGYLACEVMNVPNRTRILFHGGNWPNEVQGCIAPNAWLGPGTNACPLRGFNSRETLRRLLNETDGGRFRLEIMRW